MTKEPPSTEELIAHVAKLEGELAGTDVAKQAHNRAGVYVVAVIALSALGVVAITTIFVVRPDADHTALITTVLGFLVPAVTAFLAAAVHEVYRGVNGRFSQLLRLTRMASRAEGILIAERRSGHDRRRSS